ncbi:hypothetical protein UFOVP449_223 [uncultured Caudovirales phage]|uniref:Uncharacterized protein n=1 Tax=uncultured Caudovirales phage TaxID=2100421 RepID=A0A6J5MEV6_9CAUD|nr:hypothetical protein UFOVP449_223 [uncultured Caudovirales phage]
MKRYHITVLGYYRNSDTTMQTSIDCDGMNYSSAGCYEFWMKIDNGHEIVACYPIRQTIITSIESL